MHWFEKQESSLITWDFCVATISWRWVAAVPLDMACTPLLAIVPAMLHYSNTKIKCLLKFIMSVFPTHLQLFGNYLALIQIFWLNWTLMVIIRQFKQCKTTLMNNQKEMLDFGSSVLSPDYSRILSVWILSSWSFLGHSKCSKLLNSWLEVPD